MDCCCFITVQSSEIGIVEKFGKYSQSKQPGFSCMMWPLECLVARVSLRLQDFTVKCETKTKDNVFVYMTASVQYQVISDEIYKAHYILARPEEQMKAYIFDVIRAELPRLSLDESFAQKDELSFEVKKHLEEVMTSYGYKIMSVLITDIAPDPKVRDAMNEINASKRNKEAAHQRAEGEKILKVKKAEAECEAMYLSGVGVAKQRTAIMNGLKESIKTFSESGVSSTKDIMDLLVLNQYFDTLENIGRGGKTKMVFQNGINDQSTANVQAGVMQANASLF
jgi:regulator of protease activity HflC (stomatin/prohibitin superfamily)